MTVHAHVCFGVYKQGVICHLGFLSKGGKRDNSRVKGGGGAKTIVCLPCVKNDVVVINFIILAGSGGMLPQENFLMFQPLRLFLVASEHSDVENLSVIYIHWFPSISSQMLQGCGMCFLPHVAR